MSKTRGRPNNSLCFLLHEQTRLRMCFNGFGQVSVVGHSLGSIIAHDILMAQPAKGETRPVQGPFGGDIPILRYAGADHLFFSFFRDAGRSGYLLIYLFVFVFTVRETDEERYAVCRCVGGSNEILPDAQWLNNG